MISAGPSPHGEGGLKYGKNPGEHKGQVSLPSRGGRIEILVGIELSEFRISPSPRGEGGLKFPWVRGLCGAA